MKFIIFIFIIFSIAFINLYSKEYFIIDKNNNKIIFDSKKINNTIFIIFISNYNCLHCLHTIENNIIWYKSNVDSLSEYFILLRSGNGPISRKKLLNQVNKYLTTKKVFFDYHIFDDPYPPINLKEGIFGSFNVGETPALAIFSDKIEI